MQLLTIKNASPRKVRRQSRRDRRGATMVEFAIVAPVFFLILLASIEFSRVNVMRHTADHAAYEAARAAMVPGATADDARQVANDVMQIVGTNNPTVDIDPANLGAGVDEIRVDINIPLSQNTFVFPRFTQNRNISATATLRTERVRSLGD